GSVYPRVTGPPAHYNAIARRIAEDILRDPRSAVIVRSRRRQGGSMPLLEVVAFDGRKLGYRWEPALASYVFEGFRESRAAPARSGP
ncbi:MAG TPA: hypothetical protein VMP03_10830, partial [Methylomirabilota bacterium]|nr:hypothetical protein [Methylomirabilota bacterium]